MTAADRSEDAAVAKGNPPVLIRATNPYGYRYGHPHPWGVIHGVTWKNDRAQFIVHFPQGDVWDFWPMFDPLDPYEFEGGHIDRTARD